MSALLIVSLIWFISEVSLSYLKRSSSDSVDLDRSTLKIIWLVTGISVGFGVYLEKSGIGFINYYAEETYYAGIIFICVGLGTRWIAISQLKKYFTANVTLREDHQLVQKGLYKYVRHPAYTGFLLSFLGLAIAFNNWVSFLIILVPILSAVLYRISIEEAELQKFFGNKYKMYSQQTKKLIPWIY